MKLRVPNKVNPNSHVFKLGWTYPICIDDYTEFTQAKDILESNFGLAAEQWHFSAQGQGRPPVVVNQLGSMRDFRSLTSPLTAKYYADSRKWRRPWSFPESNFWIVFKEEKDRTLALMMLG